MPQLALLARAPAEAQRPPARVGARGEGTISTRSGGIFTRATRSLIAFLDSEYAYLGPRTGYQAGLEFPFSWRTS